MFCISHGTRCAGEVSAAKDNGVCGVGVAFGSKVAGNCLQVFLVDITGEVQRPKSLLQWLLNSLYPYSRVWMATRVSLGSQLRLMHKRWCYRVLPFKPDTFTCYVLSRIYELY